MRGFKVYFPVRNGSDQNPLVARLDDGAELELGARGVLGGQAHVGLDDGHLALAHDKHLAQLDPYQERVQQERPVQQWVVLQAYAAAVVQERLVVLVVVVQEVLGAQDSLYHRRLRARLRALHGLDVAEPSDPAGDVCRSWPLQGGHHSDDVPVALWGDVDYLEGVLVDLVERTGRRLGDEFAEDPV